MQPDCPAFIIADHRPCLRHALHHLLTGKYIRCTIKEAADTNELLHLASDDLYNAVFIDHCLPPDGGLEAFAQLSEPYLHSPVIMFGSDCDQRKVTDALIKGVAAFFS